MGLLYVNGARLHDDDAEFVELQQRARRLDASLLFFDADAEPVEARRALSEDPREAFQACAISCP